VTRLSAPGRRKSAVAFAPGHITGYFAPEVSARDPRARGSTGAGVVLELGVTAEAVRQTGIRSGITVSADIPGPLPISSEVARRLVPPDSGRVHVRLVHGLPVGQGFGMSAAGALATALAVARLYGIPRQRAVEVAHLAELFGGGGLGGVAAILGGGLECRLRPGVPPWGRIVHRPFPLSLVVGIVGGPMPSQKVLSNRGTLERIAAAYAAVAAGGTARTPAEFLDRSERFTDRVRLAPPKLVRILRAVRSDGGWAAQAMFGRTFFAAPRSEAARRRILLNLQRRGVHAIVLGAYRRRASYR
jgi:pantoate kinase